MARRNAAGFTLIGLMVVIAVINIGLAVAATSWTVIGKRAKEAELIWRGQQYVRALQCHRQTGGLPQRLDDLLESDCIRALYPEPMEPERGWRIIRESDLRVDAGAGGDLIFDFSVSMSVGRAGVQSSSGGITLGAGRAAAPTESGAGSGASGSGVQNETTRAMYERLQELTDRLRRDSAAGAGDGIVGVASFSTDESLRVYDGEITYDAWRFVAQ